MRGIQEISVIDKNGRTLSNCTKERAVKLVDRDKALWLNENKIKLLINKKDRLKIRKQIFENENYTCYICGKDLKDGIPTIDHVVPKSKNGKEKINNLKCCCKRCNDNKGSKTLKEYVTFIESNPLEYNYLNIKRIDRLKRLSKFY